MRHSLIRISLRDRSIKNMGLREFITDCIEDAKADFWVYQFDFLDLDDDEITDDLHFTSFKNDGCFAYDKQYDLIYVISLVG